MARRLQKAPAESAQSNLTLGTPGKSAKIASSKMPRLAFSQLTSQGQEKMPNGRRAHASGEGQQVLDHRFDDYRSTARSAPSRHIGELGATKMSGAFTERLSERDWRRPALAFDMRDMPSSRGSTGTFSTMDRVVTAPTISDIRMSDLQRTNPASLDRPAELDNWPSTTSAGSNSWLRRLEHFLDVRLASAADKEAKLLAFHECFAQFSELFKLYRPLLSKIYMAYDECINTRKTASVQMSKVEAEVFVLQEKAQEEVRKSAIRVTEQLKDMKDAVAKAEKEKQVALELLADTKKQLEDVHAEMERMRSEHDEIVERARAFCSGYRWILKQVVKTEEPNDMDALETVTLIQKLEAAQTETYAQQKQIDYYKNTANVVYVQNILEEERKAYALETDRITAELDNLRSAESDCRKALEISEDKCTVLETEVKSVNARLNTTFLPHLGDGPDIPEMMRTSHPLVNRKVEKRDVLEILSICMELSLKQFDNGAYPKVEQTFTDAIKAKYEQHTVAEWSRNVLEALETFRDQHECSLLGSLLANTTSSHMLIHRAKASSEAVCALTEISRRQKPFAEEDAEKEGKEASSSVQDEHVPAVDLMKELYSAFPYKTQAHWQELIDLLQSKPFEDHNINISAIARGEHEGADSQLLHLLEKQAVEEVLQYTSEFKAGLIEDASRRKSKKSELRVNVEDVRNRIKIIENQKPDCEVAAMIQRAFGIPSYEKAFQMLFGQEDEFDSLVKDASKDTGPSVLLQPVDRLLMRLDVAGLLRRTTPHATADADAIPEEKSNESPSKSPSPGTKVETPRSPRVPTIATTPKSLGQKSEASGVFFKDQEAMLTIQDNRKEAIDSILPEMDVANVPRWAKVKSKKAETQTEPEGSTNEVPFLNLIVANYRANHSNAPLNTGNTSAAAAPAPA